jgi:hypothetical protein
MFTFKILSYIAHEQTKSVKKLKITNKCVFKYPLLPRRSKIFTLIQSHAGEIFSRTLNRDHTVYKNHKSRIQDKNILYK